MASLLSQAFQNAKSENRPALLTYTVAGDNTKKKSLEIIKSISNYADICELGFPHNTPMSAVKPKPKAKNVIKHSSIVGQHLNI